MFHLSASFVSELYSQNVYHLGALLDKHAPLASRIPKKHTTEWLSESYQHAKSLRCQFERAWGKIKNNLQEVVLGDR